MSVFNRNPPFGVQPVDGFDLLLGPNPPRQVCVFCRTPVPHWKPISSPPLQIEFPRLAVLREAKLSQNIQMSFCKTVYMLVVKAVCMKTGVCSSSWVYKEAAIDYQCLTFLRGDSGGERTGNAGEGLNAAPLDVLGWGWEVGDVWLCIHCVIFKSDCTVLYCRCRGKRMHIFNKNFQGFGGGGREPLGKRLWRTNFETAARDSIPPTSEGKIGIQMGSESLLLPKHVSKGISWGLLVSSFFVIQSSFFLESNVWGQTNW